MQDLDYDVVVVGAGPAGSVAARYAALGGASVLMIEKRQEIGSPVRCGEGIAKGWIGEIGLKPSKRWITYEVEGARVTSPDGSSFCINERLAGNEVGTVIERDEFDKVLAAMAAKEGVDIMTKCPAVNVLKEDGKIIGVRARRMGEEFNIRSRVVIGADGFESQVGRWAGVDTALSAADVTSCFQYRLTNIEPDPDYCEFILGSQSLGGGYVWVFPKNEECANVGLGIQLKKVHEPGFAKSLLDKFIKNDERFAKGTAIDMVAGGVSVCHPLDSVTADGIMLVGDAGRMIDPITGGGIANACLIGKIAGECIGLAKETGEWGAALSGEYEKKWRARFEEELFRDWMAKEKLVTLSDDIFNKLISTLAEAEIEKLSVYEILKVIQYKHPELVAEFEDLL